MNRSRLEFGRTKPQKRRVLALLAGINLLALATIIGSFAAVGPEMPLALATLTALAITLWLLSFVLLIVNVAYYVASRE